MSTESRGNIVQDILSPPPRAYITRASDEVAEGDELGERKRGRERERER
jgi:hypothetical protein